MHGRAPQPLISIVLDQRSKEGDNRILRHDRMGRDLLFQLKQDRGRVRHPASVFTIDDRHLHRTDFFFQLIGAVIRRAFEPIIQAFVTQIGFKLAGIVRDP